MGAVEDLNNKAKANTKKAHCFENFDVIKIALYETLGKLLEPAVTH